MVTYSNKNRNIVQFRPSFTTNNNKSEEMAEPTEESSSIHKVILWNIQASKVFNALVPQTKGNYVRSVDDDDGPISFSPPTLL